MYCPNCRNQVADNVDFCPGCGTNIKDLRKMIEQQPTPAQPAESVVNSVPVNNINNSIQNNNNEVKKPNKSKRDLLIILGVLAVVIIGVSLFFIFNKKDNKKPNDEQTPNIKEEEKISENTFEKLKQDYESGKIDVNKYFTELVYYEYDSSKLDENYKTDETYYSTGCQSELLELLETYKDELDATIVKEYIENVTLHNVSLGDGTSVQPQSNSEKKYEVMLLDNEEAEKSNAKNHRLDKVTLSRNENFLIWYTNVGSDAITEEQLQQISNGLESTISKFEETFGVEYSYFPYQDAIFNDDYKNAKEVLKKNGIPVAKINSAMSVYIYDTGSENTLATYTQPYGAYLILDFVVQLGLNDNDGIVTFPYIVINKQGFSTENESLKQLYTHELFHHFQYLFCRSTSGERCVAGDYTEGMANFASAISSGVNSTNNFLNNWAGVYTKNVSSTLEKITDGASYGYGTFPYLYAYSEVVDNWASTLMNAHNETNPYGYIKNNTSKEDLIKISETVAYNTLAKKYDNKSLYTDKNVTLKDSISTSKVLNQTINAGAVDYYEVLGDNTIEVISGNKDYVGIKYYGYKDGIYTELASSMDKIEEDLTYYVRQDKFYVAVYNADITNSNTYTIKVKGSDFAENSEFETTFNNYNIEIEMDITIAGVNTKTISKGVIDEKHQKEYLEITTTSMGIASLNNKMYYDFNTGYSYMTQPYGGDVWWKDKSASQVIDLGVILDKLISMKNVTKIADNHYKVKMTKEEVDGLMDSGNVNISEISGDIYVEVYTENGYINRIEYDFTNMIKGLEKFTTIIKCYNYNNAGDVEIPQSVIDNAKEQ